MEPEQPKELEEQDSDEPIDDEPTGEGHQHDDGEEIEITQSSIDDQQVQDVDNQQVQDVIDQQAQDIDDQQAQDVDDQQAQDIDDQQTQDINDQEVQIDEYHCIDDYEEAEISIKADVMLNDKNGENESDSNTTDEAQAGDNDDEGNDDSPYHASTKRRPPVRAADLFDNDSSVMDGRAEHAMNALQDDDG